MTVDKRAYGPRHRTRRTITDLTQVHLNQWITEGAMSRARVRVFVSWTAARKITPGLTVTRRRDDTPSRSSLTATTSSSCDDVWPAGPRCPWASGSAGGLILALRPARVEGRVADRLTVGRGQNLPRHRQVPVLLPPNLTRLVEQFLALPHHRLGRVTRFLFPGRRSTEPIAASSLAARYNPTASLPAPPATAR